MGLTHVVGQLHVGPSKATVLSESPFTAKVTLVKDVQGQVRRDAQEWKEAYYSKWVSE